MSSYKLWKVTRDTVVLDAGGVGDIIDTRTHTFGGSTQQEVCGVARAHMPVVETQYSARELTDAEYAAHYRGEDDERLSETTH